MENPQMKRMQELVQVLNHASKVYYSDEDEIMSNYEYDQLYDELTALEQNTGIVLPNSPTTTAGADVNEGTTTITHEYLALSLEKQKILFSFQNSLIPVIKSSYHVERRWLYNCSHI